MEDFVIDIVIGKVHQLNLSFGTSRFTLIGATARAECLPPKRQVGVVNRLDFTVNELKQIIIRSAR